MEVTFSPWHLLITAVIAVVLLVNAPVLFGGVTSIEAGKYRVAWTLYGWSIEYDWRHGVWTKVGLWPWHRPPA